MYMGIMAHYLNFVESLSSDFKFIACRVYIIHTYWAIFEWPKQKII